MTRQRGFDVRIAPGVEEAILAAAEKGGTGSALAPRARNSLARLASQGTRANGTKRLRALELWEMRAGDHRIHFWPVPKTNLIAVGAMAPKSTRKHPMRRLRNIERAVHRW